MRLSPRPERYSVQVGESDGQRWNQVESKKHATRQRKRRFNEKIKVCRLSFIIGSIERCSSLAPLYALSNRLVPRPYDGKYLEYLSCYVILHSCTEQKNLILYFVCSNYFRSSYSAICREPMIKECPGTAGEAFGSFAKSAMYPLLRYTRREVGKFSTCLAHPTFQARGL